MRLKLNVLAYQNKILRTKLILNSKRLDRCVLLDNKKLIRELSLKTDLYKLQIDKNINKIIKLQTLNAA